MEDIDATTGFWIRDQPYIFVSSEKVEESKRFYLQSFPEFKKLEDTKCGWVSNYFSTGTARLKTIMASDFTAAPSAFENGRTYYYVPEWKLSQEFEVVVPVLENYHSELAVALEPYNGKEFDLSSLICTQMAMGTVELEWPDIFKLMKECPPVSDCDPCTKIGTKIAKSLIKIAALRIFADPEQSIMELPVNSIDAYNPDRKIGKFGMGFFSILYWLVGHPKRSMIIHSFSKTDGVYISYQVVIREINGSLSFALTVYPQSKIFTTGFRVYLDASKDKFSSHTVVEFRNQLSKLDYSTGATLYESEKSERDFRQGKIVNPGTDKRIFCAITENFLLNEDFATGVPLEVLLGSLFVPSISTKTIQLSLSSVPFVNNSRVVKSTGRREILFLIGGIAVIAINDHSCSNNTYIIDLPSTTRLPVSRDDFILDAETEKILLESLSIVFDAAAKEFKDVACLQLLLNKYIDFTPSSDNKRVVKRAMIEFFNKNKGILVPHDHKRIYEKISEEFIVSNTYDVSSIEDWLDKNVQSERNIWYGVKAVIIEDTYGSAPSGGGLASYLFISEKYKKSLGTNWISVITYSTIGRKLYPIGSSYGSKEYGKYENLVKGMKASAIITKESVRNYYFSVLNKLESLEDRFNIEKTLLLDMATHLLTLARYVPEDSFIMILGVVMEKFSSFKGNQTYGGGKYMLQYRHGASKDGFYTINLQFLEFKDQKEISYTIEHMVYAIKSVEETVNTHLVLVTRNCPSFTLKAGTETYNSFASHVYRQSSNFMEFQFVMAGAGEGVRKANSNIPDEVSNQIASHFIDKTRTRKWSVRDIIHLYEIWFNVTPDYAPSTFIELVKDREETVEWIKTVSGISNIPKGSNIEPLDSEVNFKLSGLTRTLFKTEFPASKDLKDELAFYSSISSSDVSTRQLQIIEIAVNEGTVKPFIEATMTELVQNSIDAVREYNPENANIDIEVSRTNSHVILRFVDRVGMAKEGFNYVCIPFLSTKTPSELVTGEMGSGFFNIYRESDIVMIDTVRDGVNRISVDIPIRDDRGRVVDITKTVALRESMFDNETRISASIPIKDDAHFAGVASRIVYTAKNVIGLAMTKNIKFNGENIYIDRMLAAKFGYFELYTTEEHKIKHESFLLTKGVPFAPLVGYFKNILSERAINTIDRNVILNITHGGYTPVQTRTRINLAPEVEKDFVKAAVYSVFVIMLANVAAGHKLYALDHINSSSDPNQLRFTLYDVENSIKYSDETWFLKYTRFYGQPTLAEVINKCIDLGKVKAMDLRVRSEFIRSIYNSPYEHINDSVVMIVNRWFKPKKFVDDSGKVKKSPATTAGNAGKYKKLTIPELKELLKEKKLKVGGNKDELIQRLLASEQEEDEDEDDKVPDPEMTKIVSTWVKVFWAAAIAANIKGYSGSPPKCLVFSSEKDKSYLGRYIHLTKTININTITWSKNDRKEIIATLKKKNVEDFISGVLKKNNAWQRCFSYSVPSSTVCHELEHARRRSSHTQAGGHDSRNEILFPGDTPQIRTFNESANLVFGKVLASGFYEKFLEALKL